jgi:hypothetical protein
MNTGSKKLQHEVGPSFCGAQEVLQAILGSKPAENGLNAD